MSSKFLDYSGLSYLWGKLKVLLGAKQDTLVSGTNIKTVNGVSVLGTGNVQNMWYGTSTTAAGTQNKVVTTTTGNFVLATGNMVRVKFSTNQTYNGGAKLTVDGTTTTSVMRVGETATQRYIWLAGEVVDFVYDGTNFVAVNEGIATTTYYGTTKLTTSATSTSTSASLTPSSLNSTVQNIIANYPVYSTSATYAVGDRARYSFNVWECNTAITTAEAWTAAHWTALTDLQTQVDAKQATLVSGTNIKTINNTSLLGSGNISISVPTAVSQLTNDSGYLTLATLPIYNGSVQ